MAKLSWGDSADRRFEAGLDRGVLYLDDGETAVPWNGLMSVQETSRENQGEPYFFDGVKYFNSFEIGNFTGRLSAYTYPDEFAQCEGFVELVDGFIIGNQKSRSFSLCYRTFAGNDADGPEAGYKIHIIYNVTASPSSVDHKTLSDSADPLEFSWDLTTIPEVVPGHRPVSHVIIDSRSMDSELLEELEDILYGTESVDGSLPSLSDLVYYVDPTSRIIIVDNEDGTWTATGPEPYVDSLPEGVFELDDVNGSIITIIDTDNYELLVT